MATLCFIYWYRFPLHRRVQHARFIQENVRPGGAAAEALQELVHRSLVVSMNTGASMRTISLSIFVAMGPVLALLTVAALGPLLRTIDHDRNTILVRCCL
jgi:hypothetical protein